MRGRGRKKEKKTHWQSYWKITCLNGYKSAKRRQKAKPRPTMVILTDRWHGIDIAGPDDK